MPDPPEKTRLFAYVPALPEVHDTLLRESFAPFIREILGEPGLDSLSFVRSDTPEWLLRLTVRGESGWIATRVRPLLEKRIADLPGTTVAFESEMPGFREEIRRWGGEEGMVLAERMFHHDSLACLARFDLESRGQAGRSRRELHLLMTEGLLDLLGFDREARLRFYERGHAWPVEQGIWTEEDLRALEAKYRALRPGLTALVAGRGATDTVPVWGTPEAAELAARCLADLSPHAFAWIEARDGGRLDADWIYLVWSLAHVNALRLGIESIPEAMLRFFLYRLLQDAAPDGAGRNG